MVSTDRFPHMKKLLRPLGLLFSCCLAVFFQIGHATELDNASILVSADRLAPTQVVRAGAHSANWCWLEQLGIDHPDQVVDFDYSTR